MELIHLMAAPFAACILLVMIHSYLGGHVLRRGVIFVDLAMAQFAAMGAALGVLVGYGHDSLPGYAIGLVSALFAAALLASARKRIPPGVPLEAIIGISYVVASSAALLIADRVPHGAEHLKHMLIGSVLWITWGEVAKTTAIYGALGALLWRLHPKLTRVSNDPAAAAAEGLNIFLWDFIFYAIFAAVVTSSVRIAGVLLVFTLLIVPSVFTVLIGKNGRHRLPVAWIFGIAMSLVGILLSYSLDFPTGATIVVVFGLAIFLVSLFLPRNHA